MSADQRFPLSWPTGWKRTDAGRRLPARFHGFSASGDGHSWKRRLTIAEGRERLLLELQRLGARQPILSTNVPVRLDGLPRGGTAEPHDPGAAVYFQLHGKPRCLACDRWNRVADNLAAIAGHVSAIRAVDRYGVGTMEQAFAGYAALPPSAEDWWLVLSIAREATADQVEEAFKVLARKHHPDVGGDGATMAKLNQARDRALFELERRN